MVIKQMNVGGLLVGPAVGFVSTIGFRGITQQLFEIFD